MMICRRFPLYPRIRFALLACCLAGFATFAFADENLSEQEQVAFQAAAQRVAPAVVQIETVGGLERVERLLTGTAPTTGLIISADGYIVTSSFNFVQKPSSILVKVPGGSRVGARLVATDSNRMITLLKIESESPLPVPAAAKMSEMKIGQWAIALGRTFDNPEPSVSVGIVSGLNRVWGKAIQTDAKISPANYGGPLVDLDGNVLGVLVPLSPDSTDQVAGVEWYDSGIGFAIPLEAIQEVLPRLQQGDLRPGLLGIALQSGSMYQTPPQIAAVRPNSPAAKSGLQAGDRIVEVDGQAVEHQVEFRRQLNPHYAGDTLKLMVARGDKQLSLLAELVAELEPYAHPIIGLLPLREPGADQPGIGIRYVYPDSPAQKAGLVAGDRLLTIAGTAVNTVTEAWNRLGAFTPGETVAINYQHENATLERNVELSAIIDAVPAELPPAFEPLEAPAEKPTTGQQTLQVAEFPNKCLLYLPENYDSRLPHGVVLWLSGTDQTADEKLVADWKSACEMYHFVFVAPHPAEDGGWRPTDLDFIKKILHKVIDETKIDPTRVVVAGEQVGATLGYAVAFSMRDTVRGLVAINGAPVTRLADNEPLQRLSFYIADAQNSQRGKASAEGVRKLRDLKYPIVTKDLGEQERSLTAEERVEICRWIDTLDRI